MTERASIRRAARSLFARLDAGLERLLETCSRATAAPRRTGLVLALVSLAAAAALPRLEIDPSVTAFLPSGDPRVEVLTDERLGGVGERQLWIALERPGVDAELEELGDALRALPEVAAVRSRPRELFGGERTPGLANLPLETLEELERRLSPEGRRSAVADLRRTLAEDPLGGSERALRDPLGLRWALADAAPQLPFELEPESEHLVLAGGALALLQVEAHRPPFEVAAARRLVDGVEAALRSRAFRPGEDAFLLGGHVAAREDATRIRSDLRSSLLWSLPLVLLFLTLSLRSLLLPHVLLLPVGVAVLWTLGFGGLALGPLTPLALSSAAILTGLGVDFGIHLCERWREERLRGDEQRATRVSIVRTGRGLVAGMLTSGAAFLSFATSSIPGLVAFGALLALGLASALLVTLLLTPLLLERLDAGRSPHEAPRRRAAGPVARGALALAQGPRGPLLALCLALLGLAGWAVVGVRGLRFDADPASLRPADSELLRSAREIQARLAFSPVPLRVLAPRFGRSTASRGGLLEGSGPADQDLEDVRLDALRSGAEALVRSGEAALVAGPHQLLPSRAARAVLRRLQATSESLWETFAADLQADGLRAAPFRPAVDELVQRLAAPLPAGAPAFLTGADGPRADQRWRFDVYARGDLRDPARRAALRTALEDQLGHDAWIADPHGIGDVVTPVLRRELGLAVGQAALLVLAVVVLSLASLRRGLAALVPVGLGFGITLGLLSLTGVPLTPGNLMAVPLILGLGVDDGVHLVLRRRDGPAALASTGDAIWRTSATTGLAFGSLLTASTPAIASLGGITLLGVVATLGTSLFVLPAVWSRSARRAT